MLMISGKLEIADLFSINASLETRSCSSGTSDAALNTCASQCRNGK